MAENTHASTDRTGEIPATDTPETGSDLVVYPGTVLLATEQIVVSDVLEAVTPTRILGPDEDPSTIGDGQRSGAVDRLFASIVLGFQSTNPEGDTILDDTYVDSAAVVATATAAVVRDRRLADIKAGRIPERKVEISLEAARRDPLLIVDMMRSASLSPFHEMVLAANTAAFEAQLERYWHENKYGLWESLALDQQEVIAAIRRDVRAGKAKNDNKRAVSSFSRPVFRKSLGEVGPQAFEYIMALEDMFIRGQDGYNEGKGSILTPTRTRERIERLMVVQSGFETGSSPATNPTDLGSELLNSILSLQDKEGGLLRVRTPDLPVLLGLSHVINNRWAEREHQFRIQHPGKHFAGERPTEIDPELLEMEALYAALCAKYALLSYDQASRDHVLLQVISTISGIETIQKTMQQSHLRDKEHVSRFLDFGAPEYTEDEFHSDIVIAAGARRYAHLVEGPAGEAEFDVRIVKLFTDRMAASGGLNLPRDMRDLHPQVQSALSVDARLGMTADDFAELAKQALVLLTEQGGSIRRQDGLIEAWRQEAAAGQIARETDRGGRYIEASIKYREEVGAAKRREEFPAQGRLLVVYGSINASNPLRINDGAAGALELISMASGMFEHVDSTGNFANNPMSNATFRDQMQAVAAKLGHVIEVNHPRRVLLHDYQCEAAHFIGRMPDGMAPEDVLRPIAPGGFGTMSIESNTDEDGQGLIADLKHSNLGTFDYLELPSELVRFVRTPEELLNIEYGHASPDWKWSESTMILYMRQADGMPTELYKIMAQALLRQQAAQTADRKRQ